MERERGMERKRGKNGRKQRQDIDWQGVRQRLDAAAGLLDRGVSPEGQKSILKARALALAREPHAEETAGGYLEVLEFLLAYETYGIEMSWVSETLPLKDLTPVPCTPPFVLGLINVRGQIVSVIDIKKFFDLPEKGLTDLNKIIIVHDGGMAFGILADAVCGVRSIPLAELQPSLPTLTGVREEYLKGVTRERTVVLDGRKLLSDRKIIVHEEMED
ncbi:MAG: purine-binding chemotaxis protein [Geobacteraceae bacterium]|nr:MAG: purine-binding chemotaxis protein [Geobacteraceae bacterium]